MSNVLTQGNGTFKFILSLVCSFLFIEAYPDNAIDTIKRKNNSADLVIRWGLNAEGLPEKNGYYDPDLLDVTEIHDQYGNKHLFFYDSDSAEVLERKQPKDRNATSAFNKYFVRDTIGSYNYIKYVLPPAFVDGFQRNVPLIKNLDEFAYQYIYNSEGKEVGKKLPGAGWTFKIYNQRGHIVAYQDALQRSKDKTEWTFHKYDSLGRPIIIGTFLTKKTFKELTDIVNQQENYYEIRKNNSRPGYTLTSCFPQVAEENIQIIYYYDNYSFLTTECWGEDHRSFLYENDPSYKAAKVELISQDHLTGTKRKASDTHQWLRSTFYLNKSGNHIQVIKENHLGGIDRLSHIFSSNGRLIASVFRHKGLENLVIKKEYTFSSGRLQVRDYINNQQPISSTYHYDSLGLLKSKRWNGVRKVDYDYQKVNGQNLVVGISSAELSKDPRKNLELKITYDKDDKLYHGLPPITNIKLQVQNTDGSSLGYDNVYRYDESQRLLSAVHTVKNEKTEDKITVDNLSYDYGGNILSIRRTVNSKVIDDLTYSYNGNLLTRVDDKGDRAAGFIDRVSKKKEYAFDANGNLTRDKNNGVIKSIAYNASNLPEKVKLAKGASYEFSYDSDAGRLSKRVDGKMEEPNIEFIVQDQTQHPAPSVFTSILYYDKEINFINTDEGCWVRNGNNYDFYFHLTDHINRVMAVFNSEGKILELKNFYPFGTPIFLLGPQLKIQHFTSNTLINSLNLVDFAFRQYSPILGRFYSINTLSELELNYSPYHYAFNSPVVYEVKLGLSILDLSNR